MPTVFPASPTAPKRASLYGTSPEPRFAFIEADILASNLPTTARASIGTLLSHKLGKFGGHWAELIGGVMVAGNGYQLAGAMHWQP